MQFRSSVIRVVIHFLLSSKWCTSVSDDYKHDILLSFKRVLKYIILHILVLYLGSTG